MLAIRTKQPADEAWIRQTLAERWGSTLAACTSGLHDASRLDGFVAELDGTSSGLVTYRLDERDCEVVTLDSLASGHGIGTALLEAVADVARKRGCRRVWLTTTNDNLPALRFYQRRGWDLVALHRGAVDEMRKLKPGISRIGLDGIALQHALELELRL